MIDPGDRRQGSFRSMAVERTMLLRSVDSGTMSQILKAVAVIGLFAVVSTFGEEGDGREVGGSNVKSLAYEVRKIFLDSCVHFEQTNKIITIMK